MKEQSLWGQSIVGGRRAAGAPAVRRPRKAGAQLTASSVQSGPQPGEYAATLGGSLVPGNLSVNTFLHMHRYICTVDLCLSFSPGVCVCVLEFSLSLLAKFLR